MKLCGEHLTGNRNAGRLPKPSHSVRRLVSIRTIAWLDVLSRLRLSPQPHVGKTAKGR